jgi:hypothetical protein
LLEEGLTGKRIELDSCNGASPMLIRNPDDAERILMLLMPCAWPETAAPAHPLDIPASLRRTAP